MATNLALPIVVLDPDGAIVFYNEAAEAILGDTFESAGEVSSEAWAAAFSPEPGRRLADPQARAAGGRRAVERRPTTWICVTRDRWNRRKVAVTAFPLVGREGELFGAFTIFWHV